MKQKQRDRISREIEGMFRQLGKDVTPDRKAEMLARQHLQRRAQVSIFPTAQELQYLQA